MTSNQPLPWRLQKRLVIIREAVVFISRVYRKGEYTLPEGTLDNDPENNIQFIKQYFITEQSELHTLYERLLYMSTPFSKAGQVNTHVLDFVNQFAIDFELIGSTAHDLRGFVEVLDRASERTFNSPTITRHLFHALVRLGEYEEAEYALHSYLYLVRLVSFGWKEKRKNGVAVSIDNTGKNKPVPSYDILLDAEECGLSLPEIEGAEVEDVSSILNVLVIATKMLCQEVSKGSDAVEVAGLALKLYQKQPKSDRSNKLKGLGAEVYKSVGVAYGVLGRQTVDPDLRPVYHEKAISALNYALEIDPTAWKTYYQLGLQQAEMHDINQAVQYVTQVLQIIPNHLPSWHLLTLLISCSSQGDYRQAMRTCDMGFQQIESLIDNTPDLNLHTSPLYEEAEQQLIFQITRTLLLCAYKGPDLALQFSKTVFTSYGKISIPHDSTEVDGAHNNMIISGSLGNLDELQMAAAQQRRRGRNISHSKSYENMLSVQTTQSLNIGRARSSSNLAARAMNTGSLLTVPNEAEAKHQHSLHLFSSRSLGYRLKTPGEPNSPINGSSVSVASSVYNPELKASASNSVASLQSMAHSVWSVQSILQPSNVPTKPSTRSILRKRRSEQTLSDLWLLTAKMYLKNKELDKAKSAVEEAEKVDWEDHPHLWCVYGQIMLAENKVERAQSAFYKGLSIDPQNIQCNLWLAKVYMIQNKLDSAEALLDASSKSNGWDSAEVWFHLGEIYRQQSRLDRTKACLFYALELESTTPIQPFSILPCFI
ncbi:hypothetical protein BDB01DRAFT_844608 [Pilobolus umbonatus]|nr:hypothetical protein BDB01DRAFT_844608 [Pilobolus umbonatus]